MNDPIDDVEFDHLLRQVMPARPEPRAKIDVVQRAIEKARLAECLVAHARLERLARYRRRNRITGIVAALLIAAVLAIGSLRLWRSGALFSSDANNADSTSSDVSTQSSGASLSPTVLLTAELLAVALVLLSASGTLSTRPTADTMAW